MNGYVGQNTKKVEEFIEYIRERIIAAANNWREIAAAFGEAKEMYGFDSDAFKRLCKVTKFSKSKASKLATIATSERLKTYAKELAAVQSWTVLYEITTLKAHEFEKLLNDRDNSITSFGKTEIISMGMVKSARAVATEKTTMRVYAKVYIDVEAVKAQLVDGDNIEALETALRDIQVNVPYLKIEYSDVIKNEDDAYLRKLREAFDIERRQTFKNEVNKMLERKKKSSIETKAQHEKRVFGQSKASVMDMFVADAEAAFREIGAEYDEGALWDRAQSRVSKNMSTIIKRVKERGGAFIHANAAIAEIKEKEDAKAAEKEALNALKMTSTFKYKTFDRSIFKDFN